MSASILVGIVVVTWTTGVIGLRRENPSRSWVDIAVAGPVVGVSVGFLLNYVMPWLGTALVGAAHTALFVLFVFLMIWGPNRGDSGPEDRR